MNDPFGATDWWLSLLRSEWERKIIGDFCRKAWGSWERHERLFDDNGVEMPIHDEVAEPEVLAPHVRPPPAPYVRRSGRVGKVPERLTF